MSQDDPRLIENPVRLSESKLWQIQRNYFKAMGVEAWDKEVPSYISSNAFIGYEYALLVTEFINDTRRHHPQTQYETFYIAELGVGSGRFSFYFLKAFNELLALYGLTEQKFCYIVTDIVEENLKFCEKNPSLAPYLEKQQLDFATLNIEEDQDFFLRKRQQPYSALRTKTPLIIIANYTFDCVKHDLFEIKEGILQERKMGIRSRYKHFDIENAKHLNELKFDYQNYDIDLENYYQNPYLNEILQDFSAKLKDVNTNLTIPLGAMQFLDTLQKLTASNYFMIAGDKGFSKLEKVHLLENKTHVAYDGCFAFYLNFPSIAEYQKKLGGHCLLTGNDNSFKVCLFSQGASFDELVNTRACFETRLERTGPDEYCFIYDEFAINSYRFAMRSLLSMLRLSQWDPDAYAAVHDRLLSLLPTCDRALRDEVLLDLNKVRDNIYHINQGEDVFNYLGIFYQTMDKDDIAIDLYLQSIALHSKLAASHHNIALIYDKQKNSSKALYHYQKAYELDKKNKFAYRRMSQLSGKPNFTALLPFVKLVIVIGVIALTLYYLGHR